MQRGKLYVGYYAAMKGFSALLIGIDIRNSELSKSPSISNLVMASKTVARETKRMLGQCDGIQNSASTRIDSSRRSKMWKTVER
ncbi:hypothetical protein RchiOBHm_Chr5g0002031 [Rosa chinensis]|uniref:Uncharacterized protein n=1 Tax=Rosa chinensis TaxID=74649 RepID=A0A2P6Q2D3_ROSCH|nr:hypothetical protein RchiOBHm_Chr5g0002031 [Rosa chinensis]